jgi:hypothetical protein
VEAFRVALDTLFADPNLGETALWQAGGVGPGVSVRVIRRRLARQEEAAEEASYPCAVPELRLISRDMVRVPSAPDARLSSESSDLHSDADE